MDPTLSATGECLDQYRLDYAAKRKADNRERVRRCRARKAAEKESLIVAGMAVPSFGSRDAFNRTPHRVSAGLASELAMIVASRLKSYDPIVQHLTIEKLLGQQLLHGMVPDFLVDPSKVKLRHSVLNNLKEGMVDHLIGVRQSKIVMAKDIVCTLASSSNMGSRRSVADVLGVDRRNLKRGMDRRLLLDTQQNAFWLSSKSPHRSDALPDSVIEVIIEWWTSETTVSPNRKDIVRHRTGVKQYEEHPMHYLQVSEVSYCSIHAVL